MNKKIARVGVAIAALGIVGYAGGAVYASVTDDPDNTTVTPQAAAPTYKEDLPAYTRLSNGGTVGSWRIDTPLDERPDYVETRVDGKVGYLKLEEIDDGFVPPAHKAGEAVDVTKEFAEAELRQKTVMIQPNAAGEIWAPVYGSDGTTVIGKQLMNPPEDNEGS